MHEDNDFSAIDHIDVVTKHPTEVPDHLRGLCIDTLKSLIFQIPDPLTNQSLQTIGTSSPELLLQWRKQQDMVRWQLCQYLKHNRPSRITEALDSLEWILENNRQHEESNRGHPERQQNLTADGLIYLYRAAALSKFPGSEADAVKSFELGLKKSYRSHTVGPRDLIWSHANYARLLRRLGNPNKANKHEEKIVQLVSGPLISLAPSLVMNLVLDEGEDTNSIVHRLGPRYFNVTEIHRPDPQGKHDLVTMIRPGFLIQNISNSSSTTPEGRGKLREQFVEVFKAQKECWITDCTVTQNLRTCKACKKALYCGVEHQKLAWKSIHKKNCKELQKM